MIGDPLETFLAYRRNYGSIFKYFYYSEPVVVVSDPALVKAVLCTQSSAFDKERDPVIIDVIGNGLLLTNGMRILFCLVTTKSIYYDIVVYCITI
jgi:hypothetical protein